MKASVSVVVVTSSNKACYKYLDMKSKQSHNFQFCFRLSGAVRDWYHLTLKSELIEKEIFLVFRLTIRGFSFMTLI